MVQMFLAWESSIYKVSFFVFRPERKGGDDPEPMRPKTSSVFMTVLNSLSFEYFK